MAAVSPNELRRHERSHIADGRHMYSEDQVFLDTFEFVHVLFLNFHLEYL